MKRNIFDVIVLVSLLKLVEAEVPYRSYPPPAPMFRPIARSGPPGLAVHRREPPPLMFPGSLTRHRMKEQFKAATAGLPMRTLMLQLRGSQTRTVPHYARPPPGPPPFKYLTSTPPTPTLIVKPLKPEFLSASPSIFKHVSALKGSKLAGVEYDYEKPELHTTKLQLRLPVDPTSAAIHTIPAPNLSVKDNKIQFFSDTKETPIVPFKRPTVIPQYEVQEHSNDVTYSNPYTGKKTLWAPDPDPYLPSPKLKPTSDPYSIPSNYQSLPADIAAHLDQNSYVGSQAQVHTNTVAAPAQLIQYYAQPLSQSGYAYMPTVMVQGSPSNLYQTSTGAMLHGMAPYNPSYIVAQSNQLFNQHQQNLNLYKQKQPNYVPEFSQNTIAYNPYTGKVENDYDATQLQQIQALQAAATQFQYETNHENNVYNPVQQQQQQQQQSQQQQFIQSESLMPQQENAALTQPIDYTNQYSEPIHYDLYGSSTQAPLSQKDLVSIFRYGTLAQSGESQDQYPTQEPQQHEQYTQQTGSFFGDYSQVENFQPSQQNELLQGQESLTPQSAFEIHQKALAQQLSSAEQQQQQQPQRGSLRIIVPDEAQSKSDENVDELNEETQDHTLTENQIQERMDNYYDTNEYQYTDDYQGDLTEERTTQDPNVSNHKIPSND